MSASVFQIPQGLAIPASNVAYVVNGQGLIECLNLGNGQVAAQTTFSAYPLVVDQGAIIGWRPGSSPNSLVVFSATQQGDVLQPTWETTIALPDWVEIDPTDPTRFAVAAALEDGQLAVTWEAHARYEGGAPPSLEVESASTHDERRTVYLHRETGAQIASEPSAPEAEASAPSLPELPPGQQPMPYRSQAAWSTQPWTVGSTEAFLVRTTEPPGVSLIRRTSTHPQGGSAISLTNDPSAIAVVTLDGQFVLIREPAAEDPSWLLFSAETGEQVASVPLNQDVESAAVVGEGIMYVVAETAGGTQRQYLRFWDLERSELRWSHLLSEQTLSKPPPLPM
jgi:hypothetical protein